MTIVRNHRLSKSALHVALALALTGCGSAKLLVDDGRKLDDKVLGEVRTYGAAATSLRPAVARAGVLADPQCDTQYDLPFEASSSYFFKDENLKMAMVRELGVNELLTVLAADPSAGLAVGETISEVRGYQSAHTGKLVTELYEARDRGKPFKIRLSSGREVAITPFKVCRGRMFVAAPGKGAQQNYHWTGSVHPLEVFKQPLTPDEATWVVLWTQGLSEQGGARMKTFSFAVGGVTAVAYVGLAVATMGAAVAAGSGAAAAGATVGTVMGQMAGTMVIGTALKGVTLAAANKANFSGLNRVAAGVFDKADGWTFENMKKLGMDPRAGLSLNDKLAQQGAGNNAFLLDEQRLANMQVLVAQLPKPPASGPGEAPTVAAEADANAPIVETFAIDAASDSSSPLIPAVEPASPP
jgi:hypothetical protein